MAHKFNSHFDRLTNEQDRGQEFKQRIENLPGKNWKEEISKLTQEFGLNTSHVMKEIKDMLVKSLDGEELSKELHEDLESFKSLYQKTKIKAFKESEDILESVKIYIDKVKTNTEKRLASVLFKRPSAVSKITRFQDVEESQEKVDEPILDTNPENQVISILDSDTFTDEGKIDLISENFRTQYQMQRISWKKFADVFELNQDYKKLFNNKDMSVKILQNLFLLKHNPIDQNARRFLDNMMDPTLYKTDSENQHVTGPKVIGIVDLSKLPPRKQKQSKSEETEPELFMQEPTTDPLIKVGEKMGVGEFLGASKMSYDKIRKYIKTGDPLAARYFGYNANYKGKLSKTLDQHFFTIGQDLKPNGSTPLINVSILVPKGKLFNEGEIYKIALKTMDPDPDYDSIGQTHQIRGNLVVDLPEVVGSGAPIEEAIDPKRLLELKSKFQNN